MNKVCIFLGCMVTTIGSIIFLKDATIGLFLVPVGIGELFIKEEDSE